jgi:hypothetical protein
MTPQQHLDHLRDMPHAVQMAGHAIGLDSCGHAPYERHGSHYYRPWRNCYCTWSSGRDKDVWEAMRADGRAHSTSNCPNLYNLTRKGLDWLGSALGITIHNEMR